MKIFYINKNIKVHFNLRNVTFTRYALKLNNKFYTKIFLVRKTIYPHKKQPFGTILFLKITLEKNLRDKLNKKDFKLPQKHFYDSRKKAVNTANNFDSIQNIFPEQPFKNLKVQSDI